MIPTLLVLGVVVGAVGAGSARRLALVGAVLSVLWGAVVGVAEGSVVAAVGGVALGALNLAVGAAVAVGLRAVVSLVRHSGQPDPR